MAKRQIWNRKSILILSARFPVVKWRSRSVAKSAYSDWQIDNGFVNRPIMARTQILVHRWGPRTKTSALFRRRTNQSLVLSVPQAKGVAIGV